MGICRMGICRMGICCLTTYYAELAVTFKAHHNIRTHHVNGVNRQWLSCHQAMSLHFVFHRLRAGGNA